MIDFSKISILGLTFHTYGLIVGVALVTGVLLSEKVAKSNQITEENFWELVWWTVIPGLIGARLWHVFTDWYLYIDNWIEAFFIWQGGMSIIGGVAGGLIGLFLYVRVRKKDIEMLKILDISIFGLPVAQAIGRWGNWVNHELYGRPTSLPWKIFIPEPNRFEMYRNIEFYHPLFLYEQLLLVIYIVWLWKDALNKKIIGSGAVFFSYVWYYSLVRILLDFLRIDRGIIYFYLGINQWLLLVVWIFSTIVVIKYKKYARFS